MQIIAGTYRECHDDHRGSTLPRDPLQLFQPVNRAGPQLGPAVVIKEDEP